MARWSTLYLLRMLCATCAKSASTDPDKAAAHWAARYVQDVLGGTEDKTARFAGLVRSLSRHAAAMVRNVWEEICASDFVPLQFEMSFGADGELPPLTMRAGSVTLEVGGKIDRVDGYIPGATACMSRWWTIKRAPSALSCPMCCTG